MSTIIISKNREAFEQGFVQTEFDGINPGFVSARLYLDSLRNPGRKLNKGAVVVLGFLSVLVAACSVGAAAPSPDQPTPGPTLLPVLSPTPLTALAPMLSLTPTAALSLDEYTLNNYINNNPDNVLSDYPAWVNAVTDESSGVALTNVDKIKDYFDTRADSAVANPSLEALDRMFAQLSLPVNPNLFKDRQLNHDWTGFGMGFSEADLPVQQDSILTAQLDADGYHRGWTLTNARNLDKAVVAAVDEFIRMNGGQGDRQALFDRITKGDFGIKEQPDDNDPLTINDRFTACETFSAPSSLRSTQPEQAREILFDPDIDTGAGLEKETPLIHDSDNSILVAMVTDGKKLWVEVRDLASPPDPINFGLDSVFDGKDPSRWHGGRLVPCGPGTVPEMQGGATLVPTVQVYPSSTPQGPEATGTPGPRPENPPVQPVPPGHEPQGEVPVPILPEETEPPIF